MKRGFSAPGTLGLVLLGGLLPNISSIALPVSLNGSGGSYGQNFDSLSGSGNSIPWANDSTLEGWSLFNSAGVAPATYAAGTGSSTTGAFYSFGAGGSSDRAFGGVASGGAYFGSPAQGAIAGWIAVAFVNDLSLPVSTISASWNGEQWRNGGDTTAQTATAQSMTFEYGFGSSFSAVSSWLSPGGAFDWTSPVVESTPSAVAENGGGQVINRGGEIGDLNWAVGQTLWLRWVERNDAGNDHGLAIDDFIMTWQAQFPDPSPTNGVPDAGRSLGLLGLSLATLGLFARRRGCERRVLS